MAVQGKGALLAAEIGKYGTGKASPAHSNIFVGNLTESVTEEDLKNAFAPFGAIESVLLTAKAGRPSGFVKMAEVEAAGRAVAALDGNQGWAVKFANYDIGQAPKWSQKGKGFGGYGSFPFFPAFGKGGWGKGFGWDKGGWGKGFGPGKGGGWTFVKGGTGYSKGGVPELREDGPEKPEPPQSDNLYVKHLPIGVTEEDLRETFSAVGELQEVRILRPDFALECAALVRFATAEAAAQARTSLDGTVVKGFTPPLYANAQQKQGSSKEDHVYLKNVPTNTSEEKIKDILGKYGEVKWCKIMRATAGQSRIGATCAALFEMSSKEEAEAAVAALNETTLSLNEVAPPMKVRFAENKAASKAAAKEEEAPAAETEAPQIPEVPPTTLLAAAPPA